MPGLFDLGTHSSTPPSQKEQIVTVASSTAPLSPNAPTSQAVLSQPFRVGTVELRNRIVSAPMERNYCSPEGYMTDVYSDYLLARARAGVALIFTEATFVRADGRGRVLQMGIHNDDCIPGIKKLAAEIHNEGALLGLELNHGGRTAISSVSGFPVVAPSSIPCAVSADEMPQELTEQQVVDLADAFGAAAARCVAADVDVIEIHGGHGYLIQQFMSPLYNKRTDRFADPNAFLDLVIERVRDNAPHLTVSLRVSVVEGVEGGLTAEQQFDIIKKTRLDLLDYLDISAGNYEAGEWIIQSGEWAPGFLTDYALRYRELGLPLGMAGRINSPTAAAKAITDGATDFVTIGRALHADPEWATAALGGTPSYRPCIACNVCIDGLGAGPVVCTVNPDVGRGTIPLPMPSVASGNHVVVVGSGPAGLSSAITLAEQGVTVTLLEESDRLGGQLELASRQKSNPEYRRYLVWAAARLAELGASVRLSTRADAALISSLQADAVITATGSLGNNTPAVGGELPHVHDLREWLRASEGQPLPDAVTVIGGDGPAMSVTDTLAAQGVAVLVVAGQAQLAPELGRRSKILVLPRLAANDSVRIELGVTVTRINAGSVEIFDGSETRLLDAPGPVLVSQGVHANALDLRRLPSPRFGTHIVGDATGEPAGSIRKSIIAGTATARRILDVIAQAAA